MESSTAQFLWRQFAYVQLPNGRGVVKELLGGCRSGVGRGSASCRARALEHRSALSNWMVERPPGRGTILAEGAIALLVTLSGSALFAS